VKPRPRVIVAVVAIAGMEVIISMGGPVARDRASLISAKKFRPGIGVKGDIIAIAQN
jgi:hypothetical protein